ncbi:unnamed protein product [Boreogadus saida]
MFGVEDSSCRDQYHNCAVVVQARLCVYPYYRGACCASCSKAPKPYAHSFTRKHLRRDTGRVDSGRIERTHKEG